MKKIPMLEKFAAQSLVESDGELIFSKEKFAELIVRECIEQASIGNGHGNNQWDRALTFAAKNIKEHFGVEE
jgi:hypothetical protein